MSDHDQAYLGEKRKVEGSSYEPGQSSGGSRGRGGFRGGRGDKRPRGGGASSFPRTQSQQEQEQQSLPPLALTEFALYSKYLDELHDRRERIYKAARDLTAESKKVIFLLHRATDKNRAVVLKDAERAIDGLKDILRYIYQELSSSSSVGICSYLQKEQSSPSEALASIHVQSPSSEPAPLLPRLTDIESGYYRFFQKFSFGMQEMVEALLFFEYMRSETLATRQQIEDMLTFELEQKQEIAVGPQAEEVVPMEAEGQKQEEIQKEENPRQRIVLPLSVSDYLLGAFDLGGELMRYATQAVTNRNHEAAYRVCSFLRSFVDAMNRLPTQGIQEFKKKMEILSQCLEKVEKLCYTLRVRGAEYPPEMLLAMQQDSGEGHEEE